MDNVCEGNAVGEPSGSPFFFPKGAFTHHLLRRRWYPSRWSGTCALRGEFASCGKRQAAACIKAYGRSAIMRR